MSSLTHAIRNQLVQDTTLVSLLGRSVKWSDGWVFADKPYVTIENTQRVLIVISQMGGWNTPNGHNTMRFPRISVDVWADPTRNDDLSVQSYDADDKIEKVFKYLDRNMHLVNRDNPTGNIRIWGTQAQVQARTGAPILGSERLDEVEFSDVSDSIGTRMGRAFYGITTFDTLT